MKSRTLFSSFLLIILFYLSSPSWAQGVHAPKESVVLRDAFWGLSIRDAESGDELVDHHAHTLMTPASTLKVVSTGTALSLLGSSYRIPTYLLTSGSVIDGTLSGDLIIKGEGDFSIGSRYFRDEDPERFFTRSASELSKRGIRRIEGQVLSSVTRDDTRSIPNPHWLTYDLGNHYASGAYDLNLFDNSYTVILSGHGRKITTKPHIPGLNLTASYDYSTTRASDSLFISLYPSKGGSFPITGVYPSKAATRTIRGALPDPPLFFARHLREKLTQKGISVSGLPGKNSTLPSGRVDTLMRYESPTLFELIRITNTYSHNLFAEGSLRLISRGKASLPGHDRTQSSLMELYRYWEERGLDTRELEMVDGSGLSPENRVTPAFLTALLGKIYRGDPSHTFMRTLPRAGKEGTLTIFLKGTPLEGKARLKSGTIRNVLAYTGYVTVGEKVYTVALIVNNYYGRASEMRKAMESVLLEALGY